MLKQKVSTGHSAEIIICGVLSQKWGIYITTPPPNPQCVINKVLEDLSEVSSGYDKAFELKAAPGTYTRSRQSIFQLEGCCGLDVENYVTF